MDSMNRPHRQRPRPFLERVILQIRGLLRRLGDSAAQGQDAGRCASTYEPACYSVE